VVSGQPHGLWRPLRTSWPQSDNGAMAGHGFTAILITLVANFSVIGTAFVALFFGGLASAALYLPIMAGLPSSAIDIINAAIALFITAKSSVVDRIAKLGGRIWKTS